MEPRPPSPARPEDWTRSGVVYASILFVVAWAAVLLALRAQGGPLPQGQWFLALFFFAYGLFTISVGYRGPDQNYYSFDRISQIASILVLGPVDAAWINGLASLVYPLQRLRHGTPWRNVRNASLVNSGTMSLGILLAGLLYVRAGGEVPLAVLDWNAAVALLLLVLAMQVLNDVSMLALNHLQGRGHDSNFALFPYGLELGSAATGVLLAVGMLALRQFAVMRYRLARIVDERTRSLTEKTLELQRLATHDTLTGLFNRRHADAWLGRQIERAAVEPRPFAVALADIDDFKLVNDQHSHATGDEVLRRVAAILRSGCRPTDVVARYGGEEFLFCFPGTTLAEAGALCEQLRMAVAASGWRELGLAHEVTISFGVAAIHAGCTLESVLREADQRLYLAKNAGRNRVVCGDAAAHPRGAAASLTKT